MTDPTDPRVRPDERGQRVSEARLKGLAKRVGRIVGEPAVIDHLIVAISADSLAKSTKIADQAAEIARLNESFDKQMREVGIALHKAKGEQLKDFAKVRAQIDQEHAAEIARLTAERNEAIARSQAYEGFYVEATQQREECQKRTIVAEARVAELVEANATARRDGWIEGRAAAADAAQLCLQRRQQGCLGKNRYGQGRDQGLEDAQRLAWDLTPPADIVSGEAKDAPSPAEGERS